jgi:T5SS/PEP-CTERM-associated repeat protein
MRELRKKNPIFLTLAVLGLCASPAIALAVDCIGYTSWTASSGNWFTGTNWSNDVPNSSKSAQINNGGTATIGSTGTDAESCDLTLGANATESGTLVVDDGVLAISFDAAVGGYGTGVLRIKNGGTVTAALARIAKVAGSNGAANVDTNSH